MLLFQLNCLQDGLYHTTTIENPPNDFVSLSTGKGQSVPFLLLLQSQGSLQRVGKPVLLTGAHCLANIWGPLLAFSLP